MCSERVSGSCSTSGTRRVNPITMFRGKKGHTQKEPDDEFENNKSKKDRQHIIFSLNSQVSTDSSISSSWHQINDREYRRGNKERTIERNWQHRTHKTKKNKNKNTNMCRIPQHANNINKTCGLPQTTGGRDEPNIVFMRKS